jgi:uncharacterized protein
LLSLPAMVPAVFLGRVVNHRLQGDVFLKWIYAALAGIGVLLLIQGITARI